ncbi:hypothetical protein [Kribbella sp. CA-294648]|uniref:hypothetical protein n=1 Tax=Kribbella sp. CA-294648 TaxID=3239948 RepID=UPI003D8BCEB2
MRLTRLAALCWTGQAGMSGSHSPRPTIPTARSVAQCFLWSVSTLRDLVREAKANKQAFQARVRRVLHSSYTHHYRRMLPPLHAALSFRC